MKLDAILQKCGLSFRESKLYLATLKLGSGSVQAIARKAGVVRSTAYEVLEALRERKFVSTFQKKNVRYYSAEDPGQLVRLVSETLDLLKTTLPQFNAFAGMSRKRPTVRFYEGREGIWIVLHEILAEAQEICGFGSADVVFKELKDFDRFVQMRQRKKIPIKLIMRESALALERKRLGSQECRNVRIVPGVHDYNGTIYLWGSKVAMFSFIRDSIAIVVESKELADTQRALFYSLWDALGSK